VRSLYLANADALELMRECRRVLRDGILRLSTPNLDWVWVTRYRRGLTEAGAGVLRAQSRLSRLRTSVSLTRRSAPQKYVICP